MNIAKIIEKLPCGISLYITSCLDAVCTFEVLDKDITFARVQGMLEALYSMNVLTIGELSALYDYYKNLFYKTT
jgi:hypothetical protein